MIIGRRFQTVALVPSSNALIPATFIAVFVNERFPTPVSPAFPVVQVRMLPSRKSLFQNAENNLCIRLLLDPAHLKPENVVQQINRVEMLEPMKIMCRQGLEGESAMIK